MYIQVINILYLRVNLRKVCYVLLYYSQNSQYRNSIYETYKYHCKGIFK